MDHAWRRYAQTLTFRDPAPFLVKLRNIEFRVAASALPTEVKQLRTNRLNSYRQLRQAAIFCYGMAQRLGVPIYLAEDEAQDYDFVASWVTGDQQHLAPVQLKEVVPTTLNQQASIDDVIAKLRKYPDSHQLTVAIHLNQALRFDPAKVLIPPLRVGSIWAFAAISADQHQWGLWGDFMDTPTGTQFQYPKL
jgi:hypothetical protein